jgi:hypothetical protein
VFESFVGAGNVERLGNAIPHMELHRKLYEIWIWVTAPKILHRQQKSYRCRARFLSKERRGHTSGEPLSFGMIVGCMVKEVHRKSEYGL